VPCFIVIGRSELGLKVKHGIRKNVVSSWRPPESVRTNREFSTRQMVSWYPMESENRSPFTLSAFWLNQNVSSGFFVLGCIGKTTGIFSDSFDRVSNMLDIVALSSTFEGLCKVTKTYSLGATPRFCQALRSRAWLRFPTSMLRVTRYMLRKTWVMSYGLK
jgi:hypothetical protein